ncbi:MAG: hypothetical protein IJY82_03960 [Oscillospiraceae bacterium]|nr:hypothetical protein [Oscillospiraceae bacterium]MBQ8731963.1 hypothetical protein [Oscillospiraceae bacterium]
MKRTQLTFALYFANRGFFPGELIADARKEMIDAVTRAGHNYIIMDESKTRYGAVETMEEGQMYAQFLKENEGKYDGVIMSLPNFGDENGAVYALRDCGVPILIQAYPDEIGKMDFEHRRDAFCGKFSIMDVFCQYKIPFTVFEPHVVSPTSAAFDQNLRDFAAVCRVVNGMKRFTLGGIGARTTKFMTVRYDELAMQRSGISVKSYDLSELFARVRDMADDRAEVEKKKAFLLGYSDFSNVPAGKLTTLAKTAVAIDDMIEKYQLDAISLRCWEEMQSELGIAPCVLLGALNDSGIAASCEMDMCNAVAMRALMLASEEPAACLDWNNNYGDDPDKCILFHCGPIARGLMKQKSGFVGNHKMFTKDGDPNCGWGTDEGLIAPMQMTYASGKTEDGKFWIYTGKGEMTDDPIEKEFFGCGGVAKIDGLQEKLLYIGKNGFRHHVSMTRGDYLKAINEAFETYLGYELKKF